MYTAGQLNRIYFATDVQKPIQLIYNAIISEQKALLHPLHCELSTVTSVQLQVLTSISMYISRKKSTKCTHNYHNLTWLQFQTVNTSS